MNACCVQVPPLLTKTYAAPVEVSVLKSSSHFSLGFTPEAKQSLVLAVQVARELHHDHLSPGHLLLGLLRLDDAFVARVITHSGTTVATLSAAVLAGLSPA